MLKKDKNNFIELILKSIICSKYFHQKIRLAITNRTILNHIKLRFYLRRRFDKIYLYTRVLKSGFGNNENLKLFLDDIKLLIPTIEIETTQGHFKGLILDVDNKEDLILYLSILSLLSYPKDFKLKQTKIFYSYINNKECSRIPIHFRFTKRIIQQLRTIELQNVFEKSIEKFNSNININDIDSNSKLFDEFNGTIQVDI